MRSFSLRLALALLLLLLPLTASAALAPVIDLLSATPQTPVPGQVVQLRIEARDPDCANAPCTTTCGTYIRGDLVSWTDNSGRTGMFANAQYLSNRSPWSGTIEWTAPATEGTYKVSVNVPDNGGSLCGGRKSTVATLDIAVSSAVPPVIDAFTVNPTSVRIGGVAQLAVTAHDSSNRPITYVFSADAGTVQQDGTANATWTAPNAAGTVTLRVAVAAGASTVRSQVNATVQIGAFESALRTDPVKPLRIAPLADGRIAFSDAFNGTFGLYDPAASNVVWLSGIFSKPSGIAASLNEIFVTDRAAGRVAVFSLAGNKLREFQLVDVNPTAIAAGPNAGELTVSDTRRGRLFVVSATTGATLRAMNASGMTAPAGIAVARGRIAAADPLASRIFVFAADGTPQGGLGDSTLLTRPQGVAWDTSNPANTRLITVDSFTGTITIFSDSGSVLGTLGGYGTGGGQLMSPLDIALMPGNHLAVTTASGDIQKFTLLTTLPPLAAPRAVVAGDESDDNGTSLNVSWTLSADDPARVTGYRIERSADGTQYWKPVAMVEARTVRYVDNALSGGTCFSYRVASFDGVMEGLSNQSPCITPQNEVVPDSPATLSATPLSATEIRLAWSQVAAPDLASYEIAYAAPGGEAAVAAVDALTYGWTASGLAQNTDYTFTIRAIDTARNVSLPATATARTPDNSAPGAPVVAATDPHTDGEIDVDWQLTTATSPVTMLRISASPVTQGWPVVTKEIAAEAVAATGRVRVSGLVNGLQYDVSAIAIINASRVSPASPTVRVSPTTTALALPLIEIAGWASPGSQQDAAGISVVIPSSSDTRDLKFEYRTLSTTYQVLLDGQPLVPELRDTNGYWVEETITIGKVLLPEGVQHVLEFRNARFPSPVAEAALRRLDFVPLALQAARTETFNSVIDVVWKWNAYRPDLTVKMKRAAKDGGSASTILCRALADARCRDTFLQNGTTYDYTAVAVSPAGWESEPSQVKGTPRFNHQPPPVTDVRIEKSKDGNGKPVLRVSWTPLSTESSEGTGPKAVAGYRVYVSEKGQERLLAETSSATLTVPEENFDAGNQKFVIRSVDVLGKESQ